MCSSRLFGRRLYNVSGVPTPFGAVRLLRTTHSFFFSGSCRHNQTYPARSAQRNASGVSGWSVRRIAVSGSRRRLCCGRLIMHEVGHTSSVILRLKRHGLSWWRCGSRPPDPLVARPRLPSMYASLVRGSVCVCLFLASKPAVGWKTRQRCDYLSTSWPEKKRTHLLP